MAYKDECEIDRLILDEAFDASIRNEFGPDAKDQATLHPPMLRVRGYEQIKVESVRVYHEELERLRQELNSVHRLDQADSATGRPAQESCGCASAQTV